MQNIIRLFAKYGSHITFILLQAICLYLVVNYNQGQRAIFLNSSKLYNTKLTSKVGQWHRYLSLDKVNDSLALHNATLLELYINRGEQDPEMTDTAGLQYRLVPANVVNNTYHLRNNHITIDKGSAQGIKPDMGVVSKEGLVGIVRNTSKNFAHVVSLLNAQSKISATVKPYGYPGTLEWTGKDGRVVNLSAIPKHADIAVGDTVVTSGYSTIFPEGIMVGTVQEFGVDRGGSSNYNIKVRLCNDIPNEQVVYVIENKLAAEQLALESETNE